MKTKMKINKNKLKAKHLVGVETPTKEPEDFLYEMYQALVEKKWEHTDKGRTIPQLKWAGLKNPLPGLSLEESLQELEKLEWVKIYKERGSTYYQMISHPW